MPVLRYIKLHSKEVVPKNNPRITCSSSSWTGLGSCCYHRLLSLDTNRLKQTDDDKSKMAVLRYIKLHSKEVVLSGRSSPRITGSS